MPNTSPLPPFLRRSQHNSTRSTHHSAVFPHAIGEAHVLWWPQSSSSPRTVLLFIPGNPGLLDFYTDFLGDIHSEFSDQLAIFAHAHIGHTPGLANRLPRSVNTVLQSQVSSAVEAFDAICSHFGHHVKIILAGHSVGAWICLQVLKARPESIQALLLLTPTISNILNTPNGRRLSPFFRSPMPTIISLLSTILWFFPSLLLTPLFYNWPYQKFLVLESLLRSPNSIYWTLTMAHEEMLNITDPDTNFINKWKDKLWIYWALEDSWIGTQREHLQSLFQFEPRRIEVADNIPHAFCIKDGCVVAQQCIRWLREIGDLMDDGMTDK